MASPVDSSRVGTNISTAATSHTINVGSPASGNLLVVFVRFAGDPGTVTFTGYTQFGNDSSDASDDVSRLYYRWADGTEGTTDAMSTVNSQKLAAICWVITGAENPATAAPAAGGLTIGTAANINPGAMVAGAGTLTVDRLSSGNADTTMGSSALEMQAQKFIPTGALTKVQLRLRKLNSPTDNIIIEVRTDDGTGKPSATVVGTSVSLAAASLTASYATYDFAVNASTSSSTAYWIVIRRSGAVDATNRYQWETRSPSDYTDGSQSVFTSSAWGSATHTVDNRFALYEGTAADYLFITTLGLDSETATATQPAGYSNLANANSGTGGAVATNCMIWGASKQATAVSSEDPGAWTSSAPNSGVSAWTIAIPPPAAAAAPGPGVLLPQYRRRADRFLVMR